MLTPANNMPGEPKKLSDSIDPSSYIKTVTNKGIMSALDNPIYLETIEVDISLSDLRAEVIRGVMILKNKGMTISEIVSQLILPIKSLSQFNDSLDLKSGEIDINDDIIKNALFEIADNLGIPADYTYENKILKISELIGKYNGTQNKRATK